MLVKTSVGFWETEVPATLTLVCGSFWKSAWTGPAFSAPAGILCSWGFLKYTGLLLEIFSLLFFTQCLLPSRKGSNPLISGWFSLDHWLVPLTKVACNHEHQSSYAPRSVSSLDMSVMSAKHSQQLEAGREDLMGQDGPREVCFTRSFDLNKKKKLSWFFTWLQSYAIRGKPNLQLKYIYFQRLSPPAADPLCCLRGLTVHASACKALVPCDQKHQFPWTVQALVGCLISELSDRQSSVRREKEK